MKEIGEGIDRMIAEMHKAGLPEPTFSEPNYSFTVTLQNISTKEITPVAPLEAMEDALRRHFQEHPHITNEEYRQLMQVDRQTAWRQLTRMVESGKLVKEGKGRHTRYRLPAL